MEEGEIATLQILQIDPAYPIKGLNEWTVQLSIKSGEMVQADQCTVTLTPFMPDHGHGTAEVEVEDLGDGQFTFKAIDLLMPGLWYMDFQISCPSAEDSEMPETDFIKFAMWLD